MIAICSIRKEPHYRRQAFESGLTASGYKLVESGRPESKRDLLVIWNRYSAMEAMADTWERTGGTVLVCENGYAGKDAQGRQLYAIAAHGHNGSGWFPVGTDDRLAALNLDVKPWRDGDYVLICGQRGIGSKEMKSPDSFNIDASRAIRAKTKRTTRVRPHPGNAPAKTKLEDDLSDAHACVVWSSTSGVKALEMGVPVFYCAPSWICAEAALKGFESIDNPLKDDAKRLSALHRMSHGQWTISEIESGEPFVRIRNGIEGASW